MNSKFRFLIEIISAIAIIVSLIFLGLEVNQSNILAKASIRQSLNETDMEVFKMSMDQPIITKALYKIQKGEELDEYEKYMVVRFQTFNFRDFDNSYYQYRMGLFDEHTWLAYRRIIKSLLEDEYVKIMWQNTQDEFSEEFKVEVESILIER